MRHHPPEQPITPDEQRENVAQMEASLAIEGLHMHPEDKALLMRSIEEGWSEEETDRRIIAQLRARDVISADEAPAAAAE